MKILGECFGVELVRRGRPGEDDHICLQLLSEDDESWHKTDVCPSSYWIDDMIRVLQNTKAALESYPDDVYPNGTYGKRFPK